MQNVRCKILNFKFLILHSQSGFTLIELLVVIAIFGMVTTAVVTNLKSGEHRNELRLSAQGLASQIREMQTMAQTGRTVRVCTGEGAVGSLEYCADSHLGELCELSATLCGDCSCTAQISPGGYGLHIENGVNTTFADVNSSRLYERGEEFNRANFELPERITVQTLTPSAPLDIVFTPPNGLVWINACNPEVSGDTCPSSAQIILAHARLPQVRTVTIYRVTGRIEAE